MRHILAILIALCLAGCASTVTGIRLEQDHNADQARAGSQVLERVRAQETVGYLFFGLVPLGKANPNGVLGRYLGAQTTLAGLQMTEGPSITDLLVEILTVGLYAPRTVWYEGDLVLLAPRQVAPAVVAQVATPKDTSAPPRVVIDRITVSATAANPRLATLKALRNAAEQLAGLALSSVSQVDNDELRDQIRTAARAYIHGYRVIGEFPDPAGVQVKLDVSVDLPGLEARIPPPN